MKSTGEKAFLFLAGLCVCLALTFGVGVALYGQERPARAMRSWQLGWVPMTQENHRWDAKVTVFDTEGVCIYVVTARDHRETGSGLDYAGHQSMMGAVAISTVSKKDLPTGAGCQ